MVLPSGLVFIILIIYLSKTTSEYFMFKEMDNPSCFCELLEPVQGVLFSPLREKQLEC